MASILPLVYVLLVLPSVLLGCSMTGDYTLEEKIEMSNIVLLARVTDKTPNPSISGDAYTAELEVFCALKAPSDMRIDAVEYLAEAGNVGGRCFQANVELDTEYIIVASLISNEIRPTEAPMEATPQTITAVSDLCGLSPMLPTGQSPDRCPTTVDSNGCIVMAGYQQDQEHEEHDHDHDHDGTADHDHDDHGEFHDHDQDGTQDHSHDDHHHDHDQDGTVDHSHDDHQGDDDHDAQDGDDDHHHDHDDGHDDDDHDDDHEHDGGDGHDHHEHGDDHDDHGDDHHDHDHDGEPDHGHDDHDDYHDHDSDGNPDHMHDDHPDDHDHDGDGLPDHDHDDHEGEHDHDHGHDSHGHDNGRAEAVKDSASALAFTAHTLLMVLLSFVL